MAGPAPTSGTETEQRIRALEALVLDSSNDVYDGRLSQASLDGQYGPWMQTIETITLGADAASITFSAIPGTFNDLALSGAVRTNRANASDELKIQFNGDGGANYVYQHIFASGATLTAAITASQTRATVGRVSGNLAGAGSAGVVNALIPRYAGTTWNKSFTASSASADTVTAMSSWQYSGTWVDTDAITSITITPGSGTLLLAGSSVTLCGIVGN